MMTTLFTFPLNIMDKPASFKPQLLYSIYQKPTHVTKEGKFLETTGQY